VLKKAIAKTEQLIKFTQKTLMALVVKPVYTLNYHLVLKSWLPIR